MTLSGRAVRATLVTAAVTALALSCTAALVAGFLWQSREQRAMEETARALLHAARREASEEHQTYAAGAVEAVRESGVGSYRVEVWRGGELLATNGSGPAVAPTGGEWPPEGWQAARQRLDDVDIVVAAPTRGVEIARIFTFSLALAAPLCAVLALLIGRAAGRRAVRPLLEFERQVASARPAEPLPVRSHPDDPAELVALTRAFAEAWERARQAALREAEFAANASHELRTPLTRMRLLAERAGEGVSSAQGTPLRALVEEVDRLSKVVDSLLILGRDADAALPRPEAVNLADTVREQAGREGPPPQGLAAMADEAMVNGDEQLLGIAVENLLDNARKFGRGPAEVDLQVDELRGLVRLVVRTPGVRIAEDGRDRLFERFHRDAAARASKPGHGLGLPLARHIARLHGGDLECISAAEEDAAFALVLPTWTPSFPLRSRSSP